MLIQLSKLHKIMPNHRVKQVPIIIFTMIIGAGFEVLGIGLIIPMINLASEADGITMKFILSIFPSLNKEDILIIGLIAFTLVFILKGLYLSFLAWITGRFTYAVKADVSDTLMKKYLTTPYDFHLNHNTAQLIRNITIEANQLAHSVLNPLLMIVSEIAVVLAISAFLLIIEPFGTSFIILFLLLFSFLFQKFVSKYSASLGKTRQKADGKIIQLSQESLGGIKDVKLLGKEFQFFMQFNKWNRTSSDVSAKQHAISQIPRMYLETISVIIFSILILILSYKGNDLQEVVPVLGVFALAAFRLLPSANRILSCFNTFRFGGATITALGNHLVDLDQSDSHKIKNLGKPSDKIAFEHFFQIKDLCYQYPGTHELHLSDINFTVLKGESVGIIGKSGAGKSTLTDVILGLLKPSVGSLYVDGVDIYDDIKSWQNIVGYVPQDIFMLDDSIRRNIAFGEHDDDINTDRIYDAINEAQLDELISTLPDGIETKLGERGVRLSGGQRQRIGIARALYRNTPILVFDEATSALDNETEIEIVSAIKNLKGVRTTIIVAHRLSTIEHCDRVLQLTRGRISRIEERKN